MLRMGSAENTNSLTSILDFAKKVINKLRRIALRRILSPGVAVIDVDRFTKNTKSDISDHLNLIALVLEVKSPRHILELGTRNGESTKVLIDYCTRAGVKGRSFDLVQAPIWLSQKLNWQHSVGDDLNLGSQIAITGLWPDGEKFSGIDFLFLDTSHEYHHTIKELNTFIPLMSPGGLLIFHDTNNKSAPTRRLNGDIQFGNILQRDVSRALEEYFSIKLKDDTFHSVTGYDKFRMITHFPWNNGLTIIQLLR